MNRGGEGRAPMASALRTVAAGGLQARRGVASTDDGLDVTAVGGLGMTRPQRRRAFNTRANSQWP